MEVTLGWLVGGTLGGTYIDIDLSNDEDMIHTKRASW